MVFLIDKYNIDSLSRIICHKHIYRSLFNGCKNKEYLYEYENYLVSDETIDKIKSVTNEKELYTLLQKKSPNKDEHAQKYLQMPNLLIYGPQGSGKKTLINLLLEDIYDKSVNKLKKVKYQITGYGNSNNEVTLEQSNYHIIKEYAQQTILNLNDCKTPFRIVLINNIDNLSYYAQTSLRCTMEKYHKTCKFILCGYQVSKIIEPIRSRCLNIRIPCPTFAELSSIIFDISCREDIQINDINLYKIVKKADGNIKNAMFLLDLYKENIRNYELLWKDNLEKIVDIIVNFNISPTNKIFNCTQIQKIREILYTIFTTNIPGDQIIVQLLNSVLNKAAKFDPILLSIIVQLFGNYETRINKGKRSIIHLEALLNSIFYHILNYKINKNINYI
jgi:replication factor C subunit 3/5